MLSIPTFQVERMLLLRDIPGIYCKRPPTVDGIVEFMR
jgi:hypothetical protein